MRKKPTYRPRPFSCKADATQNPVQFPRGVEQTSGPEQPMGLMYPQVKVWLLEPMHSMNINS